jgi:inner membrane protein
MSSFFGHSLAGVTTYAIGYKLQIDRLNRPSRFDRYNWLWLGVLIAIALIPDIDYLVPQLKLQEGAEILRITHSFVGVLLFPAIGILILWMLGDRGESFKLKSCQLVIAGLSHLLLDTLTGVYPKPWLYPFSLETFKLPFGLLPSAGRIDLTNYLFYRNIFIESGVLIPLSISLWLSVGDSARIGKRQIIIGAGLLISGCFMVWAARLSR